MTTGQITISFSFLSCCGLLSSVTLMAHFCALLILRSDEISYHHTIAALPRREAFGEGKQETWGERNTRE